MAFSVSYIFHARNQFSGVANKVQRSMDGVRKKAAGMGRQLDVVGRKFVTNFKIKATFALAATKQKLDSLSISARKFSRSLGLIGSKFLVLATLPIGILTGSLVKAASDAEETRSKFNVVFGDIRSQADMTANNLADNFGLSGTKARELLGDTGDLLTGFGFTSAKALELSREVNKLAVDLASFTNFSGGAEGASRALTKALLGERESIKSLGISILEEDVKARVKQLVLVDKMKFATLRQAKAFATLQLAQEQSKNAIGDFNRTSDSYANKVRIMEARTQDLRESFGNILLPIATKIVIVLTSLAAKFTNLGPVTKKIILATLGLIAVIGPLLLIIAAVAAAIPFMITGLSAVGVAIAFLLSPIGLVIGAIALLVAVVFSNFNAITLSITNSIESIVGVFNSMSDAVSLAMADAIDFVIGKFEALSSGAASVAKFIKSIFGAETEKIDTLSEKINKIGTTTLPTIDLAAKKSAAESFLNTQANMTLKTVAANEELTSSRTASAQIDVNMNAPEGVIKSVKTQRKGDKKVMNLGVNMGSAA